MQFLLPPTVLEAIVGGKSVFHTYPGTVIQADICGFTLWCSTRMSHQIVEMLSVVFSKFDDLAVKHDVTRIKVLGDGYIAVCGLPQEDDEHAEKGLGFAVNMQIELTRCTVSHIAKWGKILVRVGVHSGDVSAGVLSNQWWAYDLYGDIPTIAGVLEPQAKDGSVLVSDATISLLPFEMRRCVERQPSGPVVEVVGGRLLSTRVFEGNNNLDCILDNLDPSTSASSRSGSYQSHHPNPRALLLPPDATTGADDIGLDTLAATAPSLLQRQKSGSGALSHRSNSSNNIDGKNVAIHNKRGNIEVSLLPDPAPEFYEGFTRLSASILLAVSGATFVGWAMLEDPSAGAGGLGNQKTVPGILLVAVFLLSLLNVAALPPRYQRYVTPGLCSFASVLVAPLLSLSDTPVIKTSPSALDYSITTTVFCFFNPTWMWYILLWTAVLLNSAVWFALYGDVSTPHVATWVLTAGSMTFIRFVYVRDMAALSLATSGMNEEMARTQAEREVLEFVLSLKMPDHVVSRIFHHGTGDDVLNASYVIESCHVAFCQFVLLSSESGGVEGPHHDDNNDGGRRTLEILKQVTEIIDRALPSDGTGKLKYLEKIKTIGDVVMIGGSVIPSVAEKVSDEDVLSEVLTFAHDLQHSLASRNVQPQEEAEASPTTATASGNEEAFVYPSTQPIQSIMLKCIIGVDKGEVTTATVGNVNLEYDVFGTTVNTAARMMATLQKNGAKVQMEEPKEEEKAKMAGQEQLEASSLSPPNSPNCATKEKSRRQKQQQQLVGIRCTERVIPALLALQATDRSRKKSKREDTNIGQVSGAGNGGRASGDDSENVALVAETNDDSADDDDGGVFSPPMYEASQERHFITKGLGRVKAYMLVPVE